VVPENIHTPPQRVIGNSEEGGRGWLLKAKILKVKYEPKLEFPDGCGRGSSNQKTLHTGSLDIFRNNTFNLYTLY